MRVVLRCVMTAAILAGGSVHADESIERELKATYLYKFAPFVEWPAGAFESPSAPLNICVVGVDPFGAILDQAVAHQMMGEHPIALKRLAVAGPGCHIAYVDGEDAFVTQAIIQFRGKAVLTITDRRPASAAHGIVNFVREANHVRFDIDAATAAQSGLVISSKLLRLARAIQPR